MEDKIFVFHTAYRQVIYTQWVKYVDIYGFLYILCEIYFFIKS